MKKHKGWLVAFCFLAIGALSVTGAHAQSNMYPAAGKVTLGTNLPVPSKYNFPAVAFEVRGQANPPSTGGIAYVARFCNSAGSGSGVIIQVGYEHASPKPIETLRLASFDGPAKFIFFNDGRSSGLSDETLKTDIQTIEHVLDRLQGVRGVSFRWINGSSTQLGLIAQEVEMGFPELVQETDGKKGVDYARFTAVLVQAVKELKAELEELKKSNLELREHLAGKGGITDVAQRHF